MFLRTFRGYITVVESKARSYVHYWFNFRTFALLFCCACAFCFTEATSDCSSDDFLFGWAISASSCSLCCEVAPIRNTQKRSFNSSRHHQLVETRKKKSDFVEAWTKHKITSTMYSSHVLLWHCRYNDMTSMWHYLFGARFDTLGDDRLGGERVLELAARRIHRIVWILVETLESFILHFANLPSLFVCLRDDGNVFRRK